MQLIRSAAAEGEWFTYAGDGQFKIRRIPSGLEKESYFKHFGRKTEVRRKGGAVISETNVDEAQQHNQEMARYALVDSRNVLVPSALLGAAAAGLEVDAEGMVKLDGHWTDEVRRIVLAEVTSLSAWVLEQANGLTTKAAEEEAELGKTS